MGDAPIQCPQVTNITANDERNDATEVPFPWLMNKEVHRIKYLERRFSFCPFFLFPQSNCLF